MNEFKHYHKEIKPLNFKELKVFCERHSLTLPPVMIDVYAVLKAFDVTCPAMSHGIKKGLLPGERGAKDSKKDKLEMISTIKRSIEMSEDA